MLLRNRQRNSYLSFTCFSMTVLLVLFWVITMFFLLFLHFTICTHFVLQLLKFSLQLLNLLYSYSSHFL